MKTSAIACVLAVMMAGTTNSWAANGQDVDPGAVVVDTVLVRPACLVATIVGSAFFVLSLPVAATSKSVHRAARALVVKPAQATFTRPLGDFVSMTEYD